MKQCWNIVNLNLSEIHIFSFKKMYLKMSSAKWRALCIGLNVLSRQADGQTRKITTINGDRDDARVEIYFHVWSTMYGFFDTVYPKKYAHGFCFAVLCCGYTLTDFPISIRLTSLALWQSNDCSSASKATLMNMDECFMWIHYGRLHNHNKAKHNKTVCIFNGIYCISFWKSSGGECTSEISQENCADNSWMESDCIDSFLT